VPVVGDVCRDVCYGTFAVGFALALFEVDFALGAKRLFWFVEAVEGEADFVAAVAEDEVDFVVVVEGEADFAVVAVVVVEVLFRILVAVPLVVVVDRDAVVVHHAKKVVDLFVVVVVESDIAVVVVALEEVALQNEC
jgi:hypothetical protein